MKIGYPLWIKQLETICISQVLSRCILLILNTHLSEPFPTLPSLAIIQWAKPVNYMLNYLEFQLDSTIRRPPTTFGRWKRKRNHLTLPQQVSAGINLWQTEVMVFCSAMRHYEETPHFKVVLNARYVASEIYVEAPSTSGILLKAPAWVLEMAKTLFRIPEGGPIPSHLRLPNSLVTCSNLLFFEIPRVVLGFLTKPQLKTIYTSYLFC